MSLNLYFFKKGVNLQEIREKISNLYEKKQAIQKEIEQLEDAYDDAELASLNITHNLNKMAEAVGLYEVLWRPEEIGITSASQMIPLLEKGIKELETYPEKYKAFNAPNGWGKYENFLSFCQSALHRCREYPDAVIEASR
jgi:chromosome segregation ATPase